MVTVAAIVTPDIEALVMINQEGLGPETEIRRDQGAIDRGKNGIWKLSLHKFVLTICI